MTDGASSVGGRFVDGHEVRNEVVAAESSHEGVRIATSEAPVLALDGRQVAANQVARRSAAPTVQRSSRHTSRIRVRISNSPQFPFNSCFNVARSLCVLQFNHKKGSPYSINERMVPELIPVLCSQPVDDVSHKPGGRLPLLSARPTVTLATLKRAATKIGVNSLPETVTRQRRDCDLNPGLLRPSLAR